MFRDGVGDGQLNVVANYEVKQLQECFPLLGDSYAPKLAVVVVQKRISQRLFAVQVCHICFTCLCLGYCCYNNFCYLITQQKGDEGKWFFRFKRFP